MTTNTPKCSLNSTTAAVDCTTGSSPPPTALAKGLQEYHNLIASEKQANGKVKYAHLSQSQETGKLIMKVGSP